MSWHIGKPVLDPAWPIEDRMLIAVLYRLALDIWHERRPFVQFVATKKALARALEIARGR
jgi:hypothetical protein